MTLSEADSSASRVVREGDVLAGKFRVERLLGQGGMGMVVAAHHLVLDERVALKFLLPAASNTPELVGRFIREARAAAKIKSDHVARVTDVGQLEDGSPYMVMEYLEGSDLATYLAREGPLPVARAVDFVLQACEALAEAHGLGIVHRDLKPANLFCVERGDGQLAIKVLDFGISKVATTDAVSHSLTHTSALMGSPLYMSPEQMQSAKTVDARADIWSLGIILFELLTGTPPFDSPLVTELVFKIATEPAPLLRSRRPDAPEGMERVVAKCLARDRGARFQTVATLAVALKEFGTARAAMSVERILGTMRRAGREEVAVDTEASTDLAIRLSGTETSAPTLLGVGAEPPSRPAVAVTELSGFGIQASSAKRRALPVLAFGLIAVAALVAVLVRSRTPTRQASATLVADVSPSASVHALSVDADAGASPSANPAMPPPTASASPVSVPSSTPTRTKTAPSIAAPNVNCDPPTWQDESGHVHIKKGCH